MIFHFTLSHLNEGSIKVIQRSSNPIQRSPISKHLESNYYPILWCALQRHSLSLKIHQMSFKSMEYPSMTFLNLSNLIQSSLDPIKCYFMLLPSKRSLNIVKVIQRSSKSFKDHQIPFRIVQYSHMVSIYVILFHLE